MLSSAGGRHGYHVQRQCFLPGGRNGFARHFGIPLAPKKAVSALANAKVNRIEVGVLDGIPFLVTCSMAWDASIVQFFEKSRVRGIIPGALKVLVPVVKSET